MTFEVPGVDRLLLARSFLGSAVTGALADFPPELVAELHPDLAKVEPLGLLARLASPRLLTCCQAKPSLLVTSCAS